jgi:hypothetical protein
MTHTLSETLQLASATPAMQSLAIEHRECIQMCLECANICDQTLAYCLEQGGKHVNAEHIKLLCDCAESCSMSASMMARSSQFSPQHCGLCATICADCSTSCRSMGIDPQMSACADACALCESSCRRMAKLDA